ncbi:unnamed protein product, partial [Nesidiocoris tenuis]
RRLAPCHMGNDCRSWCCRWVNILHAQDKISPHTCLTQGQGSRGEDSLSQEPFTSGKSLEIQSSEVIDSSLLWLPAVGESGGLG